MSKALALFRQEAVDRSRDPIRVSETVQNRLLTQAAKTREAYDRDLRDFADWVGVDVPEAIDRLVYGSPIVVANAVLEYQAFLLGLELAPATVNRRIAAIRAVLSLARATGQTTTELTLVKNLDVEQGARDVRGPGLEVIRKILATTTLDHSDRGLRDATLIRWLFGRGLRRNEARLLELRDLRLSADKPHVRIRQKGKRLPQIVRVSHGMIADSQPWLEARGKTPGAFFCSLARWKRRGEFMNPSAINRILTERAIAAGFERAKLPDGRSITPHSLRHTAGTMVAEKYGLVACQAFLRHADPKTTVIYLDTAGEQAEMANEFVLESL